MPFPTFLQQDLTECPHASPWPVPVTVDVGKVQMDKALWLPASRHPLTLSWAVCAAGKPLVAARVEGALVQSGDRRGGMEPRAARQTHQGVGALAARVRRPDAGARSFAHTVVRDRPAKTEGGQAQEEGCLLRSCFPTPTLSLPEKAEPVPGPAPAPAEAPGASREALASAAEEEGGSPSPEGELVQGGRCREGGAGRARASRQGVPGWVTKASAHRVKLSSPRWLWCL